MTDWTKKLEIEVGLSPAEEAELDFALKADDQRLVASKMRELEPMDAPPTLIHEFERKVVLAGRLRWTATFVAGAAACLALVAALYQPAAQDNPVATSGDSLYDWHYEAVATSVLPGDGANLAGFSQVAGGQTQAR